jgi:hypothetical protein
MSHREFTLLLVLAGWILLAIVALLLMVAPKPPKK